MARQCLDRRIRAGSAQPGRRRVDWRLTTADARIRLKSLYLINTTLADWYGGAADWSDAIRMLCRDISPFAL